MINAYYRLRFLPYVFFYLLVNFCLRICLIFYEHESIKHYTNDLIQTLVMGVSNDVTICVYGAAIIFAIDLLLSPKTSRRMVDIIQMFLVFVLILIFAAYEFFFWISFGDRLNFIVVDNIFYTQHFLGDLFISYPVWLVLLLIFIAAGYTTMVLLRNKHKRIINCPSLLYRTEAFLFSLLISMILIAFDFKSLNRPSSNTTLNEISKNGLYQLISSYHTNELYFDRFYTTLDENHMQQILSHELKIPNASNGNISRRITSSHHPLKKYNIVMIIINSLDSELMHQKYQDNIVTPNLNSLQKESIYSENMVAMSAKVEDGVLAMMTSLPVLSGVEIIDDAPIMANIGSVLDKNNYSLKYISGMYGYLSDMGDFFEKNNFQVIQYDSFYERELEFVNSWGISDSDLFRRLMKENDESHSQGKPFFNVLFTSAINKPYSYPNNKVSIPSKTNKLGALQYLDYVIGEFIQDAKTKPWFSQTIFVITSANNSLSPRSVEDNPYKSRVPIWIYSPGNLKPSQLTTRFSQIDLAPTLLDLLGITYESNFLGCSIFAPSFYERVFMVNHQSLVYEEHEQKVVMKPKKILKYFKFTHPKKGLHNHEPSDTIIKEYPAEENQRFVDKAIAYFQIAIKLSSPHDLEESE